MPNGLNSSVKLFADNTSLFSGFHNITDSANLLNSDLSKINEWLLRWKMTFNLGPAEQAKRSFSVANPHREIIEALCLIII